MKKSFLIFFLSLGFVLSVSAESRFCGQLVRVKGDERRDVFRVSAVDLYNEEARDSDLTPYNDRLLSIKADEEVLRVVEHAARIRLLDYLTNERSLREKNIQVCLVDFREELETFSGHIVLYASSTESVIVRVRGEEVFRGEVRGALQKICLEDERESLNSEVRNLEEEIRNLQLQVVRKQDRLLEVEKELRRLEDDERERRERDRDRDRDRERERRERGERRRG